MGALIHKSRNHFSFIKGRPNSPSQMYKAYIPLKLSRKESEKCIMLPANELSATHKGVFLLLPFFFQVYRLWNITYCNAELDVVKRIKMGMQRKYTANRTCFFFLSFSRSAAASSLELHWIPRSTPQIHFTRRQSLRSASTNEHTARR